MIYSLEDLGPIPFRFNLGWIQEGVVDLIKQDWSTLVVGSLAYVWESKLHLVKKILRPWAKKFFKPPGHVK